MKIELGIQPNCSECSIVIFSDKLTKKQKDFFNKFIKDNNYKSIITPKGNISIETEHGGKLTGKEDLWKLRDVIEGISKHNKLFIYENEHYRLVRDESYDDAIEDKTI